MSQGRDEELMGRAQNFLSHPEVRSAAEPAKRAFLLARGLSRQQVEEAVRLASDTANKLPAGTVCASQATAAPSRSTLGSLFFKGVMTIGVMSAVFWMVWNYVAPQMMQWGEEILVRPFVTFCKQQQEMCRKWTVIQEQMTRLQNGAEQQRSDAIDANNRTEQMIRALNHRLEQLTDAVHEIRTRPQSQAPSVGGNRALTDRECSPISSFDEPPEVEERTSNPIYLERMAISEVDSGLAVNEQHHEFSDQLMDLHQDSARGDVGSDENGSEQFAPARPQDANPSHLQSNTSETRMDDMGAQTPPNPMSVDSDARGPHDYDSEIGEESEGQEEESIF